MSRKYLIISGQRTGSTFLIDCMHRSGLNAYEELFLVKYKKWPTNAGKTDIYTFGHYTRLHLKIAKKKASNYALMRRYLRLLHRLNPEGYIVKIMYSQFFKKPHLIFLLLDRSYTKVHWIRKDFLKSYLSQIAKAIVGFSHNIEDAKKGQEEETATLDYKDYLRRYRKRRNTIMLFDKVCSEAWYYEDFVKNGINIDGTLVENAKTRIKPMSLDYEKIFTNYQEFLDKTEKNRNL